MLKQTTPRLATCGRQYEAPADGQLPCMRGIGS
jgi:hypothetical protein